MERKVGQTLPISIRASRDYNKTVASYSTHSDVDKARLKGEGDWLYFHSYPDEEYRGISNINSWYQDTAHISRLLYGNHNNDRSLLSNDRYTVITHRLHPSYRGVCKFFEV